MRPKRLSHFEPNPALVRQADQRAKSIENRIADRITAFAGSMPFVYIHIAWFSCRTKSCSSSRARSSTSRRRFTQKRLRVRRPKAVGGSWWQHGTRPWQPFGIHAAHASWCN